MRDLAAVVYVHAADGSSVVFGPGDEVPPWAAGQISNPAAWVLPPDRPASPQEAAQAPPRGGPGSSAAAWRAYAARVGVSVPGDADRDVVVGACEAAGLDI